MAKVVCPEPGSQVTLMSLSARCSDYDHDCRFVCEPLLCWIGGTRVGPDGTIYETPASDGYCPLLRGTDRSNVK